MHDQAAAGQNGLAFVQEKVNGLNNLTLSALITAL